MSDPATEAVERELAESDPQDSGPGGMGVSSERTGAVRGTPGQVTHGKEDTSEDASSDASTGEPPDPLPS